jgi:hypothetical protein
MIKGSQFWGFSSLTEPVDLRYRLKNREIIELPFAGLNKKWMPMASIFNDEVHFSLRLFQRISI